MHISLWLYMFVCASLKFLLLYIEYPTGLIFVSGNEFGSDGIDLIFSISQNDN